MPKPEHKWLDIPGAPRRIPFAQGDRVRSLWELALTCSQAIWEDTGADQNQIRTTASYLLGTFAAQHKNAIESLYVTIEKMDETIPRDLLLGMLYEAAIHAYDSLANQQGAAE